MEAGPAAAMEAGPAAAAAMEALPAAAAAAEADTPHPPPPHPPPPYTSSDDVKAGLQCYLCTNFKGKSWLSIAEHLRQKHSICRKALHGSYLGEATREEAAQQRKQFRINKKNAPAAAAPSAVTADASKKQIAAAGPGEPAPAVAAAAAPPAATAAAAAAPRVTDEALQQRTDIRRRADGTIHREADGGFWQTWWVRFNKYGEIAEPLQLMDSCNLPELAHGRDGPFVPQGIEHSAASAPASTSDWRAAIPKWTIKQQYAEVVCPEPSVFGNRGSGWPVKLEGFQDLEIPAFNAWMQAEKRTPPAQQKNVMRNVRRLLHIIEAEGWDLSSQEQASDSKVLVGLYLGSVHNAIFLLPLLKPVYTWSRKVAEALKLFCEWHLSCIAREAIISDDPFWPKASACIKKIIDELAGVTKDSATQGSSTTSPQPHRMVPHL